MSTTAAANIPFRRTTGKTSTATTTITASSRALPPARSALSTASGAAPGMPTSRSSPAMRPSSPLSPGYKASAHYDSLHPPAPRTGAARHHGGSGGAGAGAGDGRHNAANRHHHHAASLRLPSLPRFHPANFAAASSSGLQSTPDGPSPAPGPVSPRAHQRMLSDAQKQLLAYQRDVVAAARASSPSQAGKPVSPRLAPLGSPGPVTPLELEGDDGYLVAGARSAGADAAASAELVDRYIQEESRRRFRRSQSPQRASVR